MQNCTQLIIVFLCKQYLNQHADGTHKSLVVELNGETWKQEIAYSHSNPLESIVPTFVVILSWIMGGLIAL